MKPLSLYRRTLKESWDICRTHLFMWPLAFFAHLIVVAGTFQIFFDLLGTGTPEPSIIGWYPQTDFFISTFMGWNKAFEFIPWGSLTIYQAPMILFFFFLGTIVITLAVISYSSEGGLIYSLNQLHDNKKTTFLESFRQGLDKFWHFLVINVIYVLLYSIVYTIIIVPLIYAVMSTTSTSKLLLAILAYLIMIPLIIIFDLVARYSLMYIIIYQATIKNAFRNAWLLFRTNWIISIETALFIFVTWFAAFLIMSMLIIPLLTILFQMFGLMVAFSNIALQIVITTMLVLFFAIVVVFVTFFTALQMSIWVGVFRKITTGEHKSKIHRLFIHLPWIHKKIF